MRLYLLFALTLAMLLQLAIGKVVPYQGAEHHHSTTVASLRMPVDNVRFAGGPPSGPPPNGGPPPPPGGTMPPSSG